MLERGHASLLELQELSDKHKHNRHLAEAVGDPLSELSYFTKESPEVGFPFPPETKTYPFFVCVFIFRLGKYFNLGVGA